MPPWSVPDDPDDLNAEEQETIESALVDDATAAETIQELEAEILILEQLEEQARVLVHCGQDRKWEELSRLLQNTPQMRDADGRQRKLIIFSEHRDTMHYLEEKIGGLLGTPEAIVTVHGGVKREERRHVQEIFRNDPAARILCCGRARADSRAFSSRIPGRPPWVRIMSRWTASITTRSTQMGCRLGLATRYFASSRSALRYFRAPRAAIASARSTVGS